jgi:hypothetical protein
MNYVYVVVEDALQEAVIRKLLSIYRQDIQHCYAIGHQGNVYIRSKLRDFNNASEQVPYIVITDLDRWDCAPSLKTAWMNFEPNSYFLFRIAVKEVEAWILADRENFSKFLGIATQKIPHNTESIENPKAFLIQLARNSRKKNLANEIAPQGKAPQGPGYNLLLTRFIEETWDAEHARANNNSLDRLIRKLINFPIND